MSGNERKERLERGITREAMVKVKIIIGIVHLERLLAREAFITVARMTTTGVRGVVMETSGVVITMRSMVTTILET